MDKAKASMVKAALYLMLPFALFGQAEKNRYTSLSVCEIVEDSRAQTGFGSTLCVDLNGGVHIAYYDATNGDLKYARRPEKTEIIDNNNIPAKQSSNWIAFTVDKTGNTGSFASIAVDSFSRPSISYYDAGNKALKIARYFDSAWHVTYVDTGNVGMYSSLAIDKSDRPCISYYDLDNKSLKFARYDGRGWNIETVDRERDGDIGLFTSLKLGKDNLPRIAYYDNGRGKLKFAKTGAHDWEIEDVDTNARCGQFASLALSSNDTPYISYYDPIQMDLKYAVKKGYSWELTVVDAEGSVGQFASLALDKQENAVIAYYDFTGKRLKLAEWRGQNWFAGGPVLNRGDHGQDISFALDKNGVWYVSYRSVREGKICYSDSKSSSQIPMIPGQN